MLKSEPRIAGRTLLIPTAGASFCRLPPHCLLCRRPTHCTLSRWPLLAAVYHDMLSQWQWQWQQSVSHSCSGSKQPSHYIGALGSGDSAICARSVHGSVEGAASVSTSGSAVSVEGAASASTSGSTVIEMGVGEPTSVRTTYWWRRRGCKGCGGSSTCKHGRQRSQCKECGGSSIWQHG